MVAPESYRTFYVCIERADMFAFEAPEQLCCSVSLMTGATLESTSCSLRSSLCPLDQKNLEVLLNASFTFPFDCLRDRIVRLALHDAAGRELAFMNIDTKTILERESASVQCKLKDPRTLKNMCMLRARTRVDTAAVPTAACVHGNPGDLVASVAEVEMLRPSVQLMLANTPDNVANREASGVVTNSVEMQLYYLQDFVDEATDVVVLMGKHRFSLPLSRGSCLNRMCTIPYHGERFIRIELMNNGQLIGLGAVDLCKFVTHPANVIGGNLKIEDIEDISNLPRTMGVLCYRLQRYSSTLGASDVSLEKETHPANASMSIAA